MTEQENYCEETDETHGSELPPTEINVLPELEGVKDFIRFRLEEMEREGLFVMKRIKAKA